MGRKVEERVTIKNVPMADSYIDRDVILALVHDVKRKARPWDVTYVEMNERLKDPKGMAKFASSLVDHQQKSHIAGWQVILSLDIYACGTRVWHGSAMLWPQGRCSTHVDWQNLGIIVALSGAPSSCSSEQIRHQLETIHPNRPHHWWWHEQDEEDEEEEKHALRDVSEN